MASPDSEERRATGAWSLEGTGADASGEGDLLVTDDAASIGPRSVELLNVDDLKDEERVLTLALWPAGTARLTRLARRHETFARALREARDRARLAGLLAHGIDSPASSSTGPTSPSSRRRAIPTSCRSGRSRR